MIQYSTSVLVRPLEADQSEAEEGGGLGKGGGDDRAGNEHSSPLILIQQWIFAMLTMLA